MGPLEKLLTWWRTIMEEYDQALDPRDTGVTVHMLVEDEEGAAGLEGAARDELEGLLKDRARLDFLEEMADGMVGALPDLRDEGPLRFLWVARPSSTGRGYRLHQSPSATEEGYEDFPESYVGRTAREALDAAMEGHGKREALREDPTALIDAIRNA